MGKQRTKDRGYLTTLEWKHEWGGHKSKGNLPYRRLPFHCCAISFLPFDDPVCTTDGTCFDIVNLVPYVQKHHKHPVTGEPCELRDLIQLHFAKNADGEYQCPVLNKVFTQHTHIVAIRTTGNVYCYEAIEELCLKPKNMKDLLDDTPFKRSDIIHVQDPLNLSGRELDSFDHVKKELTAEAEDEERKESVNVNNVSEDTKRVLAALGTSEASTAFEHGGGGKRAQALRAIAEAKSAGQSAGAKATQAQNGGSDPRLRAPERQPFDVSYKPGTSTWNTDTPKEAARIEKGIRKTLTRVMGEAPQKFDANGGKKVPTPYFAKYEMSSQTTGAASRGFTSTAMPAAQKNERIMVLVERKPKKKGYLRLHTSKGDLNIELHCDIAPRACENFMALAEGGYYSGTKFHRCIKNFMIQGGDPTGTGRGGTSIYGPTFKDEFDTRLTHSGRGVLACANSGPGTNGSQFYILLKSAHHLDNKHTVFGRVVGGLDVLTKMENVPTDEDDRPKEDIEVTGATIFVNPYKEEAEAEAVEAAAKHKQEELEELGRSAPGDNYAQWFSNPGATADADGVGSGAVGKYMKPAAAAVPAVKKQKTTAAGLGNFDAW